MSEPTAFTLGCVIVGALLIAMTLGGSILRRLQVSAAMIHLVAGMAMGPWGISLLGTQRRLMAWFGLRGIGSLYCLFYAIDHDLSPALAEQLLSITGAVVVGSAVLHGISVTPLMQSREARKKRH